MLTIGVHMKNYHVVAIVLIAGFIAGCAVPAHAVESVKGSFICLDNAAPDEISKGRSFNITQDDRGYGWLVEMKNNPAHTSMIKAARYALSGTKESKHYTMLMYTTHIKGMNPDSPAENVAVFVGKYNKFMYVKHFSNKGFNQISETASYICELN